MRQQPQPSPNGEVKTYNLTDAIIRLDKIGVTLDAILYLTGASAVALVAIYLTIKFNNG